MDRLLSQWRQAERIATARLNQPPVIGNIGTAPGVILAWSAESFGLVELALAQGNYFLTWMEWAHCTTPSGSIIPRPAEPIRELPKLSTSIWTVRKPF